MTVKYNLQVKFVCTIQFMIISMIITNKQIFNRRTLTKTYLVFINELIWTDYGRVPLRCSANWLPGVSGFLAQ